MKRHPASYRDPSGYIYEENGVFLRAINPSYFSIYKNSVASGIYELLWDKNWLIPHEEISNTTEKIVVQPKQLDFITYPYEWSFTAYKHAAQLTLRIQMLLLEKGFSLKDASAFNVTFSDGKAIFIDTLSIENYTEGEPWKALQQFNEHFLAPLVLSTYYGSSHLKTLQHHINGLSLKEVSALLPWRSKLNTTIYSHIHYLGKQENQTTGKQTKDTQKNLSKNSQLKILKALDQFIGSLKLKENTQWANYYQHTNYDDDAFKIKADLVTDWIKKVSIEKVIDLGGNDGTFINGLLPYIKESIVCDIDQSAIDQCYKNNLKNKRRTISMVSNLLEPAPAIGFNNSERDSFIDRMKSYQPDVTMALAIIHHLTITGNVPFEMSASFFASFSDYLLIEFPDRTDSWVTFLLDSKRDARSLYDHYNKADFEKVYYSYYDLIHSQKISGTHRTLYLLRRIER